jgi:hypothetical protein
VGAWIIVHVERMSRLRLKKGGIADICGLVALAVCQQRYLSADPNIECGALLFQRSVDGWYSNLQLHRSSLLLLPFSSQYIGVRRDELPRVSRASCRPSDINTQTKSHNFDRLVDRGNKGGLGTLSSQLLETPRSACNTLRKC